MHTPPRTIAGTVCACCLIFALTPLGCTSAPDRSPAGSPTLTIQAADYSLALDAAKQVLIDHRFVIDRVDARRGLITTLPKQTAGLATPWDAEQSSTQQELSDLVNQQDRVIRITLTKPAASKTNQSADAETTIHVQASIIRTRRPGWRLESESVRLSTHAATLDTNGQRAPAVLREPISEDTQLSSKIADAIQAKLDGYQAARAQSD